MAGAGCAAEIKGKVLKAQVYFSGCITSYVCFTVNLSSSTSQLGLGFSTYGSLYHSHGPEPYVDCTPIQLLVSHAEVTIHIADTLNYTD